MSAPWQETPVSGRFAHRGSGAVKFLLKSALVHADAPRPHGPHQHVLGLEARVSLADHRIMEYVWNVPWDMKTRDGLVKNLLRQSGKRTSPG